MIGIWTLKALTMRDQKEIRNNVIGKWGEGDPCYQWKKAYLSLTIMQKVNLVNGKLGYIAEEISQ